MLYMDQNGRGTIWQLEFCFLSSFLLLLWQAQHVTYSHSSSQKSVMSPYFPDEESVSERLSHLLRVGHSRVYTGFPPSLSTKPFPLAFAWLFLVCSVRMLCKGPRAKHLCRQRNFPQILCAFLHDIIPKTTDNSMHCGAISGCREALWGFSGQEASRLGVPSVLSRGEAANPRGGHVGLLCCPLI